MADFIHSREYLNAGDSVLLNCDTQCNFRIMDDNNFRKYRSGQRFEFYGGGYRMFPASITVPRSDNWNIVIDLGGGKANIKYSLNVIQR